MTTATQADMGQSYYVEVATSSTWNPPLPADVTTAFVYDGDGGRIKQTTAGGTTTFLGESLELDPAGVLTKYVFAGSQRIASVKPAPGGSAALPTPTRWYARAWDRVVEFFGGSPAEAATGLTIQYYHGDHLGSSNLVTDQTGAVVQQLEYTPYGAVSVNAGSVEVAHKFTGQREDTSTGLYFYHARYYDSQLGRFISPDTIVQAPADPQSLNRYAYARNNPVKYVDPSGYGFWSWFLGVIGAIVGAVAGFFLCGLDCAVSGAVIGFNLGYNAGSWIDSQSSGGAPPDVTFPSLNLPGNVPEAAGPTEGPSDLPEAPRPGQPPSRTTPSQSPWTRPLLRLARELAKQLANWNKRTASAVEVAEQISQASMLVEIYARPTLGNYQHLSIVYNNGQNLWELLNVNGRIHFNKPDTEARVNAEKQRWGEQLKGPLLVNVDPAKFGPALADQEKLEGQSYYLNFFFNNSNFSVRWVINQSITYGIGPAFPKGGLGKAPDFLGDPTK